MYALMCCESKTQGTFGRFVRRETERIHSVSNLRSLGSISPEQFQASGEALSSFGDSRTPADRVPVSPSGLRGSASADDVCDEVTSALDRLVAEEVLKLLQRLQNDLGVSYLSITHDLATVKAISDEIIVMLRGRIVEQGEKQEVLTPPHHEYTELLLSSVPEMDPDWLGGVLKKGEAAETAQMSTAGGVAGEVSSHMSLFLSDQ